MVTIIGHHLSEVSLGVSLLLSPKLPDIEGGSATALYMRLLWMSVTSGRFQVACSVAKGIPYFAFS